MSPHLTRVVVATSAIAALVLLLLLTGPRPEETHSGVVRRMGGPCLELERWDLFGWNVVGQTYSITDTREGLWHDPVAEPPCVDVPDSQVLVRLPFDAPNDVYRLCGLADERGCLEFRRVPFQRTPGP